MSKLLIGLITGIILMFLASYFNTEPPNLQVNNKCNAHYTDLRIGEFSLIGNNIMNLGEATALVTVVVSSSQEVLFNTTNGLLNTVWLSKELTTAKGQPYTITPQFLVFINESISKEQIQINYTITCGYTVSRVKLSCNGHTYSCNYKKDGDIYKLM